MFIQEFPEVTPAAISRSMGRYAAQFLAPALLELSKDSGESINHILSHFNEAVSTAIWQFDEEENLLEIEEQDLPLVMKEQKHAIRYVCGLIDGFEKGVPTKFMLHMLQQGVLEHAATCLELVADMAKWRGSGNAIDDRIDEVALDNARGLMNAFAIELFPTKVIRGWRLDKKALPAKLPVGTRIRLFRNKTTEDHGVMEWDGTETEVHRVTRPHDHGEITLVKESEGDYIYSVMFWPSEVWGFFTRDELLELGEVSYLCDGPTLGRGGPEYPYFDPEVLHQIYEATL